MAENKKHKLKTNAEKHKAKEEKPKAHKAEAKKAEKHKPKAGPETKAAAPQVQKKSPKAKPQEPKAGEKHAKKEKSQETKASERQEKRKKEGKEKAKTQKTGKEKPKTKEKTGKKKTKKKPAPKISKSKETKKLSKLVLSKKRRMFRGRFGKRSIRKISNKKWQKWRKPKGIDIYFKKEDGLVPGTGYRTSNKIRFVHPSGYRERLVRNIKEITELEKLKESTAARISAKVGRKKKTEMVKKADELKIKVLNR